MSASNHWAISPTPHVYVFNQWNWRHSRKKRYNFFFFMCMWYVHTYVCRYVGTDVCAHTHVCVSTSSWLHVLEEAKVDVRSIPQSLAPYSVRPDIPVELKDSLASLASQCVSGISCFHFPNSQSAGKLPHLPGNHRHSRDPHSCPWLAKLVL